jgi:nicotinate-nucleotide--dimethylbenzimidazole phosphoribosyltransferase
VNVVDHVIESITPASGAQAEAARLRVAGVGVPMLERLAVALAAAQHSARPRTRRTIVVVASGVAAAPLAHAIADGSAALCGVARTTGTPIVLVDAGVPGAMPASAVRLEDTLEAGIALAVSLDQTDVIAVGALGDGGEALLAGLILCAASTNVPVILDGAVTGAAAVRAAVLAPAVTGYLIAAHAGLPQAAQLERTPVFEVGLGHGEGTGAAMVLPLIDQLAALAATNPA